eukprot:TRINITY_DN15996_c0_g1_i1.p1 TRINITY_DN15996_c0_g1~~TRINITY_DN15996_c0_g1_i1.p1  ORF type:complete len:128 (+),score=33.55 TRINITY_DN15996_c0_g1_i1:81-464(+)
MSSDMDDIVSGEPDRGQSGWRTVVLMTALGFLLVAYSYSTFVEVGHGFWPWLLMYLGFALLLPLFGMLLSVVCYCPYLLVANCFRLCCPGFVMHDYFGMQTPKDDSFNAMPESGPLRSDPYPSYETL